MVIYQPRRNRQFRCSARRHHGRVCRTLLPPTFSRCRRLLVEGFPFVCDRKCAWLPFLRLSCLPGSCQSSRVMPATEICVFTLELLARLRYRYFTSSNTVSCVAFSRDGGMLAAGERGHQPLVTVWSLATGITLWEMATGHRFGIGCVAFTPSGGGIATMGFKHDRMLRVRSSCGAAVSLRG